MIGNAPNKHCQLEPAPTWLVKQHRQLLAPCIALLINTTSLSTGSFPAQFKHAIVTPLLKKDSPDSNQLKSFRLVSKPTVPFLSKLLEKAVQKQLQCYLTWSDAVPSHQSAYRQFHGSEMALIKEMNDLLMATDYGQVSALCLLDLTPAFDTYDRSLLLACLHCNSVLVLKAAVWLGLRHVQT